MEKNEKGPHKPSRFNRLVRPERIKVLEKYRLTKK